jgi:hypothetical protein
MGLFSSLFQGIFVDWFGWGFRQMGKKDDAERFEVRLPENATAENLSSRTLSRCKKPPNKINRGALQKNNPASVRKCGVRAA